jgi:N-acetylglucosaminyldiphosphoundecaprenol N-acetyl-beta-D-mannosaminyltransferase
MRATVIKMDVNVTSIELAVKSIGSWLVDDKGRYVCVSNVHMCMEVFDNPGFAAVVNGSDLTVADGKPIAMAQRALGYKKAQQVRGEDFTLELCKEAEEQGFSVGFFGATDELLAQLKVVLYQRFPKLHIAYVFAPPFRQITDEEDAKYIEAINSSGISVLFVGLGCPKQEVWMAKHNDDLNCVMLGVGAAFDFIAGNKTHTPNWMQSSGLEWLFRLFSEPKRLWKRYLKQNPRFVYYFTLQLLGKNFKS